MMNSSISLNTSNASNAADVRTVLNVVLETSTLCLLFLLSVAGNVLVCIVVFKSRRMQSTTNYFVVSLAWADLYMTLFCMPFYGAQVLSGDEWVAGSFACKLSRFILYISPGITSFTLLAIAVDRYYTIIYPLSFKVTRTTAKRMIGASWFLALLLACPAFYFYLAAAPAAVDGEEGPGGSISCQLMSSNSLGVSIYTLFMLLATFILPLLLLTAVYTKVVKYIWTVGVTMGRKTFQRTSNPVPRNKVKTIKMLIFININFFVLWVPYYFLQMWDSFSSSGDAYGGGSPTLLYFVVWLTFGSCLSKPLIYSLYNTNFRRGCKEVLCRSNMKCYRSNTYAITNSTRLNKKNHIGPLNLASAAPVYSMRETGSHSPAKLFNRNTSGDKKIAWPLSASTFPDTYL